MWLTRSVGVMLHPTSLPGGRLGPEAYAFVDWLEAAGARFWQVLPLTPPDVHGSPYASASAFAGWSGLLHDPEARVEPSEARALLRRHSYWLPDWVEYAGGEALADQVRFEREWSALRGYAARRGVRLVGDLPIYVAAGSCDHVRHPELFSPGDLVAGAPPDPLNAEGQLWGNPLYDWEAARREGYRWWTERLRRLLELVDVARCDHFRGFAAYWCVAAGAASAREGRWSRGPGARVFRAARAELGSLPLIAEDLGVITPDVVRLRDELGFPGMAVLLWAFDERAGNPHRLEHHRAHQVVFTSTHDTDTLAGHFPGAEPWPLLELALSSRATLALVPAQDVLGLGSDARMNRPGEIGSGNWSWRLQPGELGAAEARRLRRAALAAGRV